MVESIKVNTNITQIGFTSRKTGISAMVSSPRKTIFISNIGSADVILIKTPDKLTQHAIKLKAGDHVCIDSHKKEIYAYTESGSTELYLWEDF
jgi:3-isopropylmalate dehydratase small subunit